MHRNLSSFSRLRNNEIPRVSARNAARLMPAPFDKGGGERWCAASGGLMRRHEDWNRNQRRLPGARFFAALAIGFTVATARADLPEITLSVAGHKITAEVASTDAQRSQGLMHRRMLPENRGMLFVFPRAAMHSMWMMNTYIPLSVAFLDANGVIINVADMEPHSRNGHGAARPAKYALETNQGWFRKRGIKPGTKVEGLGRAPRAR